MYLLKIHFFCYNFGIKSCEKLNTASDIDIPEKLGSVMTDEDDNQLVTSEKKTQNSLQLQSTDGEIRITAYK